MKLDDHEARPYLGEQDDGGGSVEGACVLVPKGKYELRYIAYETAKYFGTPKVIVHFAIISPEEYAGLPVDRFYNVQELTGPPGRFGKYKALVRGHLIREFKQLIGCAGRLDRISFARLRGKRVIGEIETVVTNHKREELSQDSQYSRISRLIEILPDEGL